MSDEWGEIEKNNKERKEGYAKMEIALQQMRVIRDYLDQWCLGFSRIEVVDHIILIIGFDASTEELDDLFGFCMDNYIAIGFQRS